MAGFIAAQRNVHGVPYATGCRALGVSEAWFYKWRYGDASPQHARRAKFAILARPTSISAWWTRASWGNFFPSSLDSEAGTLT